MGSSDCLKDLVAAQVYSNPADPAKMPETSVQLQVPYRLVLVWGTIPNVMATAQTNSLLQETLLQSQLLWKHCEGSMRFCLGHDSFRWPLNDPTPRAPTPQGSCAESNGKEHLSHPATMLYKQHSSHSLWSYPVDLPPVCVCMRTHTVLQPSLMKPHQSVLLSTDTLGIELLTLKELPFAYSWFPSE
jgi:hypothetical protein